MRPLFTTRVLALGALIATATLLGCQEEGGVIRLTVRGEFVPASLQYGEVPVGMSRGLAVVLQNTGPILMTLDKVELPADFSLRGVKGLLEGTVIQPGAELGFEVVFLPTAEGVRTGQMVVTSAQVQIPLDLSGTGVIRRVPVLSVEPATINFGAVALGETSRAAFVVRNSGTADGVIDGVSLASTSAPLQAGDEFLVSSSLPVTVPMDGTVTLEAMFAPNMQGVKSDVLILSAGTHAPLSVTVNGEGVIPLGDILCEPTRILFGQVERGMVSSQNVRCTARGGAVRLIGAATSRSTMFVLPSPPSTVDLTDGQGFDVAVEFRPDGLPGVEQGLLTITYAGGNGQATANVDLIGEVIPPPTTNTAISVTLTWSSQATDADLHLVRQGGALFDDANETDCFYANRNPDWGTPRDMTDDPFLDVDDIDGLGPEAINLSRAAAGTYNVYVHYYSDHLNGPTNTTVQIHLDGTLAGTFTRMTLRCNQVWHVGTINWNGMSGTFAPTNAVMASTHGVCL